MRLQICKALLVEFRDRSPSTYPAAAYEMTNFANATANELGHAAQPSACQQGDIKALAATGGVPLELVARCASRAFAIVRAACDDSSGGWDACRAGLAAQLVEAEALPQAGRWHRRDLAPALAAAWRAVLRALARVQAGAESGAWGAGYP